MCRCRTGLIRELVTTTRGLREMCKLVVQLISYVNLREGAEAPRPRGGT
jgi:hypothetical protein